MKIAVYDNQEIVDFIEAELEHAALMEPEWIPTFKHEGAIPAVYSPGEVLWLCREKIEYAVVEYKGKKYPVQSYMDTLEYYHEFEGWDVLVKVNGKEHCGWFRHPFINLSYSI